MIKHSTSDFEVKLTNTKALIASFMKRSHEKRVTETDELNRIIEHIKELNEFILNNTKDSDKFTIKNKGSSE